MLQYNIPFTGLKLGKHLFEFDIDEVFFREFEYSLVKNGKLTVRLELDKQETMLLLDFTIEGTIFSSCDVCLADYPNQVIIRERQIAKFGDVSDEDDQEEIILLSRNDHAINVSTLIYEYINLAVPYISRCDDEGNTQWCDKEMIDKLKQLSVNEKQEESNGDPRWEALKNIKNN